MMPEGFQKHVHAMCGGWGRVTLRLISADQEGR
jgi:hypothetical protein